jgi:hypothetical protein
MYHSTVRHLNAAAFPGDEKRNIPKGTDEYAPAKKHLIQIEFLDREAGSYPPLGDDWAEGAENLYASF